MAVSEGFDEEEEKKAEEQEQMDPLETVKKGIKKELVDQKTEPSPVYTQSDEEPVEVKFFFFKKFGIRFLGKRSIFYALKEIYSYNTRKGKESPLRTLFFPFCLLYIAGLFFH